MNHEESSAWLHGEGSSSTLAQIDRAHSASLANMAEINRPRITPAQKYREALEQIQQILKDVLS